MRPSFPLPVQSHISLRYTLNHYLPKDISIIIIHLTCTFSDESTDYPLALLNFKNHYYSLSSLGDSLEISMFSGLTSLCIAKEWMWSSAFTIWYASNHTCSLSSFPSGWSCRTSRRVFCINSKTINSLDLCWNVFRRRIILGCPWISFNIDISLLAKFIVYMEELR